MAFFSHKPIAVQRALHGNAIAVDPQAGEWNSENFVMNESIFEIRNIGGTYAWHLKFWRLA